MKRKWLVVGIILLFIGVSLAPSINQSVVTASQDDDLVEVTTQACGIKGYRDTTVKLTKQQYQELEQYLIDFRARLNQTSTREEAIIIFKEAVVELDKYGLLPKGMSVKTVQKLVVGPIQNIKYKNLIQKSSKCLPRNGIENTLCLVAGLTSQTYPLGFIGVFKNILEIFFFLWLVGLQSGFQHPLPFQMFGPVAFGYEFWQIHGKGDGINPAHGWITAVGSNGLTQMRGPFYGGLYKDEFGVGPSYWDIYVGMNSFTGLTIGLHGVRLFLGFTLHLSLSEKIPGDNSFQELLAASPSELVEMMP